MDFDSVIEGRRSIRSFDPKDIEKEKLSEILNAVKYVPSGHNLQDYKIYVIKDEKIKKSLVYAARGQDFVERAPIVFVVCADIEKEGTKRGYLFSAESASMAAYIICLKAFELGLGSCWIGDFNEEDLRDILQLPQKLLPIAVIPIGYSKENPKMPKRREDYYETMD